VKPLSKLGCYTSASGIRGTRLLQEPVCKLFWAASNSSDPSPAIYYTSSTISGCFSGLIAYGVDKNLDGVHGFHAWQWLYIVEGIPAIGLGFIILFLLPSFPDIIAKKGSRYFKKVEIDLALQRVADGMTHIRMSHYILTIRSTQHIK
jgi:hypothetical protein